MSSFTNKEVNETILNENKSLSMVEDYGKASDCASSAREATYTIAGAFDESPNDDLDFYLTIYDALYMDCYLN